MRKYLWSHLQVATQFRLSLKTLQVMLCIEVPRVCIFEATSIGVDYFHQLLWFVRTFSWVILLLLTKVKRKLLLRVCCPTEAKNHAMATTASQKFWLHWYLLILEFPPLLLPVCND